MQADRLAQFWGFDDIQSVVQKSGRVWYLRTAAGEDYYLKRHGQLAELAEYPVLRFLNQNGIHTELPLSTREGRVLLCQQDGSYALYPALPGSALSDHFSAKGEQQAYQLGRAIGLLHRGLAQYPLHESSPFPSPNLLDTINQWGDVLRSRGQRSDRLMAILDEFNREMPGLYPQLDKQLIHRDSHPSNILFAEDGQPGYLDFELLRISARIFDPCYCATSILVDAGSDEAKQRAWPKLFGQIMYGYDAVCPLNEVERRALRHMVFAIQIIFTGWYTQSGNHRQANLNQQLLVWLYENCPEI